MTKKAEQVQEKQPEVNLQQFVAGLRTITLTYDVNGQPVSIATSDLSTSQALRSTKVALANVAFQIDTLLLATVEREAKQDILKE